MVTKCNQCNKITLDCPEELGWKKIRGKYVCVWCDYENTTTKTKPLIIANNMKGGNENENK